MKLAVTTILGLCLMIPSYWHLSTSRQLALTQERLHYQPSYEALYFSSLDQQLLMSELLFFEASFYYGAIAAKKKQKPDNTMLLQYLDTATRLNPYNIDAYYFGQAVLTWDAGMVKEMNLLLERGVEKRNWDFYLPFFLGFNYSYFLNDYQKAAEYTAIAAQRNPQAGFLATLASRQYYEANKTDQAISYLKAVLAGTNNEMLRRSLVTRLTALESISFLENAAIQFERKMGRAPRELSELVVARILKGIPPDPYGGTFYLDNRDGRIKTTSKMSTSGAKK